LIFAKLYSKYKINKAIKDGLKLGKDCRILGNPSFGSEPYLIRIGEHCTITSGVKFVTHDGGTWVFRDKMEYKHIKKYGTIEIGNNCFIGINTILMPNVKIGDNCVIGAGSIVTKNIPSNSVAAGNPDRVLMTLDEYISKCEKKKTPFPQDCKNKKDYLIKFFWGN
jgi:acetyltransferase-like isoleucine patch superfamily enzyme